jgi:histidine kinase-like protein
VGTSTNETRDHGGASVRGRSRSCSDKLRNRARTSTPLRRKLTAWLEQRGRARLYGERAGDTVRVTVTDTGCGIGLPPERARAAVPSASGGRGLRLIDEVTDRMTVDTGAHGTRVTMVWRPAALRRDTAS